MIQVNNQAINWNNNTHWADDGNTITSQNTPVSVIQTANFLLNVNADPNDFFIFFDVVGYIPNLSILSIDLIIQNIGSVTWEIKKRNPNTANTRAFRSQKLKLKKIWFNNATQNVSLKFTFQNAGNTNVALSNININTSIVNPVVIQGQAVALAGRTTNGTGTSGPNGPR